MYFKYGDSIANLLALSLDFSIEGLFNEVQLINSSMKAKVASTLIGNGFSIWVSTVKLIE
ncbi:MAG: Uncharacterised protein [Crocinitomicaceae bacterium]|nr:MAG: Uncharacterised protein [Crocinitomicaceae bacterium]